MADIDRTYEGAVKEIFRLCGKIADLERDNKFLTEQLQAVAAERNALRRSYALLTEEMLEKEAKNG